MLKLYAALMRAGAPLLRATLSKRSKKGKEDPARLGERQGVAGCPRPSGPLVWLHAASVGEAQSLLALIAALRRQVPAAAILVTTGTVTSARLMADRLPPGVIHQFYPVDHPDWVAAFLDHWQPALALWAESELWPCMLGAMKRRGIPAVLVNARLSERSFKRWQMIPAAARGLLGGFALILTQTEPDAVSFRALGAPAVATAGNLKYSAAPLPYDDRALAALQSAAAGRQTWLYASTHDGEEDLACRLHKALKGKIPGLLTVTLLRHPHRREAVLALCEQHNLRARLRGASHALPQQSDDIYIIDTLGEPGLFYRLCPVACIGRSFSHDGGGGHNPIEAAQLNCAVLHGPHVQNLAAIYEAMDKGGAALCLADENDFRETLERLLGDDRALAALRETGAAFVAGQARVLDRVVAQLAPFLEKLETGSEKACA